MDKKTGFLQKLKSVKNIEIIIAVVSVVIMLIVYFTTLAPKSDSGLTSEVGSSYCDKMQSNILRCLGKIEGAGSVDLVINWENGLDRQDGLTGGLGLGSSSTAVSYPKAVGVLIICQGGENVKVKYNMINAVSTLLDIDSGKIIVLKMK